MALKADNAQTVEIEFPKIGHFWQDSGVIGLKNILNGVIADEGHDVHVTLEEKRLVLSGEEGALQTALDHAYDRLVDTYYNVSTQSQVENRQNYNFYYDSDEDKFVAFPKKKSRGIAQLIFDKAARPSAREVKWADKKKHLLPEEYAHLQERMKAFLRESGIEPKSITGSSLLLDGPNRVRPNVKLDVGLERKKSKGNCYLCGKYSANFVEVASTVLPLLGGSSAGLSFNPEGGRPEKACWKCALLGKFVPENGFYYRSGDGLHMFFPYSSSLKKMDEIFPILRSVITQDPNYNRNFDIGMGPYFQKGFEIALAFFYTLYLKLARGKRADEGILPDLADLWDIVMEKALVEFYVLSAAHAGNAFFIKSVWDFQDAAYLFRLFDALERHSPRIDIREVMRLLIDFDAKNDGMTLERNRICERIMRKRPILDLVERFVFHANRSKKIGYIRPIVDFLLFYRDAIGREKVMIKEAQDVAVKLGKRLGAVVGSSELGRKGDLFALRRTRNMESFLEQLNRLQFRLGESFVIPPGVYEGSLSANNFGEFKQFCMISALNSYFAAKSKKGEDK